MRKRDGAGRAIKMRCTEREIITRIIDILLIRDSRQDSLSRASERTNSDPGCASTTILQHWMGAIRGTRADMNPQSFALSNGFIPHFQ
jgi:hypothetical protein